MKKTMKRTLLVMLALVIALLPALALADGEADGAGNFFAGESTAAGKTIAGDLYGAGQNVDASGAQVGASAILAGQYVSMNNGAVGGSLRAAGYQVSASNTVVDVNATLAGRDVILGTGFSAKGVYVAAQNVNFAGACDTLCAMAQDVVISGTVNGDVNVNAETVTVTDSAVIQGNLNVEAANEPVIAAGASVGAVSFTQSASDTDEATEGIAPVAAGAWFAHKALSLVKSLLGGLVLAVVYYFLIRGTIADGASMMKTRPVAMPVSGFVTLISLPIAAIILLVTVVGAPAGVLALCLYGLALGFSGSFAGCMLGKLVFPKLHTLVAYLIGVAAVAVVKIIPVVGGIVTLGTMIYTLGYFIQKIYLGFQKKPTAPADAPQAAVEAEPQPMVEAAPQAETL